MMALMVALVAATGLAYARQQSAPASPPYAALLVPVIVTDEQGRPVSGLDRSAFVVQEKQRRLAVTDVRADGPSSVVLVLDTSASMARDTLMRAGAALHRIVAALPPDSEVMVVIATTGEASGWERDRRVVIDAVDRLGEPQPKGATALHAALVRSLRLVGTGRFLRRAVIVVSDGQDTASRVPFDDVVDAVRGTSALVYGLVMTGETVAAEAAAHLKRLESSGGRMFRLTRAADRWTAAADAIAAEVQHHYLLSVAVPGPPDRRRHAITVTVTGGERVTVRARAGY